MGAVGETLSVPADGGTARWSPGTNGVIGDRLYAIGASDGYGVWVAGECGAGAPLAKPAVGKPVTGTIGVGTTGAFKCAKALSGNGGALARTLGFAGGWLSPGPFERTGAGAAGGSATISSRGTSGGADAADGGSGVVLGALITTGNGAGLMAFAGAGDRLAAGLPSPEAAVATGALIPRRAGDGLAMAALATLGAAALAVEAAAVRALAAVALGFVAIAAAAGPGLAIGPRATDGLPAGSVFGAVLGAGWLVFGAAGEASTAGFTGAERMLGGARRVREPLPDVGALGGADTLRLVVRGGVSGLGLRVLGPSSRGGALGNGTPRPVRFDGGPERRAGKAGGRERSSAVRGAETEAGDDAAADGTGAAVAGDGLGATAAGFGAARPATTGLAATGLAAARGFDGGGGLATSTCDGGSRPATS